MSHIIPEEKNPYSGRTPFDILGVKPNATARQLADARDDLIADIDETYSDKNELRIAKRAEINGAYEAIRTPKARFCVEIFFFDPNLGKEDCDRFGKQHSKFTYDFSRIFHKSEGVFRTRPSLPDIRKVQNDQLFMRTLSLRVKQPVSMIDPVANAKASIVFDI